MRLLLFSIMYACSISVCFTTYAQRQNVWVFGDSTGIDFNSGNPAAIRTGIQTAEGCASVCDLNGQLLFYTEGSYIWDRNHHLMPNGSGLTVIPLGTFYSESVTSGTAQGALIVPMPDSAHKYYVFSLASESVIDDTMYMPGRLSYSVVDMNLNEGMGDIVPNQKGMLLDSNLMQCLSGIAGDQCNVWVMVRSLPTSEFRAFEITSTGINMIPVISPGFIPNTGSIYSAPSQITFSPDRKKLAATKNILRVIPEFSATHVLELYDFDKITGMVSNRVVLDTPSVGSFYVYYGISFSPDNLKVYGNFNYEMSQFDLSSADPTMMANSKTLVGSVLNGITSLKLMEDGKIYFLSDNASLGAIEFPNLAGTSCQFNPISFQFPDSIAAGLNITLGLPNVVPEVIHDTPSVDRIVLSHTGNTYTFNPGNLQVTAPSLLDYRWDFGDGDTSNSASPTHHYSNEGSYTVRLIVFNCSGSDTVNTTVSIATGIVSITEADGGIAVYPNPAQRIISLQLPDKLEISELSITNSVGNEVYKSVDKWDAARSLDVSWLPDGYYILRLHSSKDYYHLPFTVVK